MKRWRAGSDNPYDEPPPWIIQARNEYDFRTRIPLTSEQYQEEPADKVDLFLRFAAMDAEAENEAIERAKRDAEARARR